jgi:hypothetical protein
MGPSITGLDTFHYSTLGSGVLTVGFGEGLDTLRTSTLSASKIKSGGQSCANLFVFAGRLSAAWRAPMPDALGLSVKPNLRGGGYSPRRGHGHGHTNAKDIFHQNYRFQDFALLYGLLATCQDKNQN